MPPEHARRQPAPVIFGCAGTTLSAEETALFRDVDALGLIVFARNIESATQVAALTETFRAAVGRDDAPVLIDQEGGRVARLKPPLATAIPPAALFGRAAERDLAQGDEAARLAARLIADDLRALGITVDCAPVLDLRMPGAHDVIGDRAFSGDPGLVARLGAAACSGFLHGGVTPVIKHLPGHGRALSDSHLELPRIDLPVEALVDSDFLPFRLVAAAMGRAVWAMTAHIVFAAVDPRRPATCSPDVVADIIRSRIGFDGVLVSDDLGMAALTGPFGPRAAAALDAGCDLVLHCSGKLDEMRAVADGLAPMSDGCAARLAAAEAARRDRRAGFDRAAAIQRLAELLGEGAGLNAAVA